MPNETSSRPREGHAPVNEEARLTKQEHTAPGETAAREKDGSELLRRGGGSPKDKSAGSYRSGSRFSLTRVRLRESDPWTKQGDWRLRRGAVRLGEKEPRAKDVHARLNESRATTYGGGGRLARGSSPLGDARALLRNRRRPTVRNPRPFPRRGVAHRRCARNPPRDTGIRGERRRILPDGIPPRGAEASALRRRQISKCRPARTTKPSSR
jgi:hypothetical protein